MDVQRELARTEQRAVTIEAERNELHAALEAERAGAGQARAALFDATRQLVDLVKALEREREALKALQTSELPFVRAALEETHAHLTRKVVAMEALEARVATSQAESERVEHELRHARETIALMETSVFWRLRGFWARLSRLLGRPT